METFVKGDIIIIPFPFSDLSSSKKRPAFVIKDLGQDIILCQISSQAFISSFSVIITTKDFLKGELPVSSVIHPQRIFTADKNIIIKKKGTLKKECTDSIIENIHKALF